MNSEQMQPAAQASTAMKRLLPAGFLLVVFSLIAYAYAPSLRHGPRCDHWCYLVDTVEYDDFTGIVAHSWSYSRTRTLAPGDTALFRPLLFVLMAAEKAVFANHFRAWQAAGIALHGVACGLLFLILRRLRVLSSNADTPRSAVDLLPYVLTLFFAVNFAIAEQVIWSHITGYLLFAVLALAALRLVLEFVSEAKLPRRRAAWLLASVWLLILAASFTYELGQLCALCVALFLAAVCIRQGRPKKAAILFGFFAAIIVLYQSANHFDRWYHRGSFHDDLALADLLERLPSTGENLARYLSYVLVQPFLPMHCPCVLSPGRMQLEEQLWQGKVAWDATAVCCVAIVSLATALVLYGMTRLIRATGNLALFMFLTLAFAACHVALIVCGRLNLRPESLTCNPYYVYITLLFLTIAAAVPLLGLDRLSTWLAGRNALLALVAGLFVLTVLSLDVTRRINAQGAPLFQPLRAANATLGAFVRQHEKEPDFRLAFVHGPSDADHVLNTALIFYHRYMNAARPTYLLAQEQGRLTFTPVARWRSEHPGEEPECYPDLVCAQPGFFVFRADDRYYAVPHREFNQFLAVRDRSSFPLFRPSLPELLALLAANRSRSPGAPAAGREAIAGEM